MKVENDVGAGIATSVLQGLACGTFLYVTFFEVLPHELQMPDGRMLKLFFTILGFSTSCGILLLDAQARGFQMNANWSTPGKNYNNIAIIYWLYWHYILADDKDGVSI